MTEYNHAYSLGFSLEGSFDPNGRDVTEEMLRAAILKRIKDLDQEGPYAFINACDAPWDTYKVENDNSKSKEASGRTKQPE